MTAPAEGEDFDRGRPLRLDFECLNSIAEGINEVRVWSSDLLGCKQVGKRMDVSAMDEGTLPEAATLMSIKHRNVVPINTAALVGGGFPPPMRVVEIVTPFYPRGSVTDALLRAETFVCSEAVAITQAALRGLAELHEVHGIIHRDIKSGNVLLPDDGTTAKIADLGLAGRMDDDGKVPTALNPTLYTSPEWFAEGVLRRQSDIYGIGLMLRELIAGPFPYADYTTTFVTDRLARQVSPLRAGDRQLPVWVPRSLRRIVNKAQAAYWQDRYTTASEMDAALAGAVIADWQAVDDLRWQAPFRHHPERAVRVDAVRLRKGGLRLSLRQYRTTWRRVGQDLDVASLEVPDARRVFDSATAIAAAR